MSSTTSQTTVPNFIVPVDLTKLSDEQLEVMVEGIRNRRMKSLYLYQQTEKLKDEAARIKLEDTYNKKMVKLAKLLETTNNYLEKLELASNEVRVLRVQLGSDPMP